MRKLSAIAIVAIMLFVSISMVSFNVRSEDAPRPFVGRSIGYPHATVNLDAQQTSGTGATYPGTSISFAQLFKSNRDGILDHIDLYIGMNSGSPGDTFNIKIWNTDQAGNPTTVIGALYFHYGDLSSMTNWYSYDFSSQEIDMQNGREYAVSVISTAGITLEWRYGYSPPNPYANGYTLKTYDKGAMWETWNTTYDFSFKTYISTGTPGMKKVAWHLNGKYAIAVAGNEQVWKYDREATTWSLLGVPNSNMKFYDVIYDPTYGRFWLVGQDTTESLPGAYSFDGSAFTNEGTLAATGTFYSVAPTGGANSCKFLAVGVCSDGSPVAAWKSVSGSWFDISGFRGVSETLNDITWNGRTDASTTHYAVGKDNNGLGIVYSFHTGNTTATLEYTHDAHGQNLEPAQTIAWNPQYSLGADYDYALIGTGQHNNYGNCYKFNGSGPPVLISTENIPIYDIGWHPHGELAVLVGGDPGNGKVYHHNRGMDGITDMSFQMPSDPGIIYGVAVKGPSSPSSAILIGVSGSMGNYVDALDTGTEITVDIVYPHLYWIGFNDTAHASMLEQQVSPDDWYEFSFAANYSRGWSNCEVIVQAWYDNGNAGGASTYPAENEQNRCLAFSLYYFPSGPSTTLYPGNPEYSLGVFNDQIVPGGTPGEDIHYVTLGIFLGAQTRSADGSGFTSGDADTDADPNNALQDINSWDFNITVRDSTSTNAKSTMYSEFGVNRVVSISVAGNPNGNTPPGSSDVLLFNPSQITYSANTGYWVNVSIPDLLENGVGPASIAATNIAVGNTNVFADHQYTEINANDYPVGKAFTGAHQDLCVWGNRTEAQTYISAPNNGSVSFGPFGSDYNAAWTNGGISYTSVNWWVTVPGGTAEGVYRAVITITIEAEGS